MESDNPAASAPLAAIAATAASATHMVQDHNKVTLGQALDRYAEQKPNEVVLICARQDGRADEVTRAALEQWSNRLAQALINLGVGVGDLVPIDLPTSTAFLAATVAIFKAGGTPMPMSYRLPDAERNGLLELAQPKVVLSERSLPYPTLSPADVRDGDRCEAPQPVRITSPIKALASGGSTGKPKLIITTGELYQPFGDIPVAQMLRFLEGDLKYSPGPLYHNGPFWFSVNMLYCGGRVLLNERFSADRCLTLIEQYRPQVLNLVPTMMQRMLRDPSWETTDLASVRVIWHLAAPCPAWAKQAFIDRFGGSVVLELWAATEATGVTALDGDEWMAHPGSVGKPVGTEILIVDEDRQPLPTGEVGEIFTRFAGQPAPCEYRGAKPLETIADGYASVGDLGWVDEEGFLYLADRRTDLIISGGANIFPAEIEAVISQHPGVTDVAVIGLNDPDLGKRVHAVIEAQDFHHAPSTEEILDLCNAQLVRYKVPRGIEFVQQLPRNDAGKIRRSALRDERGG